MKIPLALIIGAAAIASALAGPETIVRERAKELNNQNNVRQGVAPPTQSAHAPPAQGTQGTAAPVPSTQNLMKLQVDLASISMGATITGDFKQKLAADIISAAQGAKPSAAAAAKLAESLTAGFVIKPLSASSRARFLQELDEVLNPGKYPQANMGAIYGDIQAIFQENGLDRRHSVALVDDIKGVAVK